MLPMTFLPIVERELRVASRRALTYWVRLIAALLALLVFAGFQIIAEMAKGAMFNLGQIEFSVMKWMSFAFACSMGVFLTSDSLSEEKREGTLGLLFLTDLRGHDVVLGKLFSNSIRAVYGLLATFPVLGLTFLIGGVAGAEFGRVMLVICNTLFFSLSLGLIISSVSRDTIKTMNGTLLASVIFFGGLPLVDSLIPKLTSIPFKPILSIASPVYLFAETDASNPSNYWLSLGIQHAMGWGFLLLASLCAPRAWQEKSNNSSQTRYTLSEKLRFGGIRARAAFRRRLLDKEPFLWLALRDRWLARLILIVTMLGLAWLGTGIIYGKVSTAFRSAYYVQTAFVFLVELWVASQASRFFVDAVRNGALELLLITPTSPGQIARSQWSAIWRTFLIPVLILILLQIIGGTMMFFQMRKAMTGMKGTPGFSFEYFQLVNMVVGVVSFIANLAAVAWFGMWMGVTTRKHSIAVLKTLCFVLILPWLALIFVQGVSMAALAYSKGPFWISSLIVGGLCIGKDLFFIAWSRRRLLTGLREKVSRGEAALPLQSTPSPVNEPPIIMPAVVSAIPVKAEAPPDVLP
ncbi:MAG: family transporter protein [Pedosphaera sp.]|nr:family transporter protein [Pedosphaera sp.]